MFLLGGTARSATNFLATVLNNASNSWEIEAENFTHHPRYAPDFFTNNYAGNQPALQMALQRYSQALGIYFVGRPRNYGQISPQYTYLLDRAEFRFIKKRGLLFRHPENVLISICNRDNRFATDDFWRKKAIEQTILYFTAIETMIKKRIKYWRFEDYTTDLKYIDKICQWAGITDIDYRSIDLSKKINSKEDHKQPEWYNDIAEILTKSETRKFYDKLLPFIIKHYSE